MSMSVLAAPFRPQSSLVTVMSYTKNTLYIMSNVVIQYLSTIVSNELKEESNYEPELFRWAMFSC